MPGLDQLKWLEKRKQELLPIQYFHLVFTIPSELNHLVLINQKVLYTILFKAASQTVCMLAGQDQHLGVKPGCIAVLHTWGQNLMHHPHIHMIVTGGGLSVDGNKWINSKNKFFIPVKVISRVRIAISNHRILSMDNNRICFKWKDYRDKDKQKVMSINANEFIRRFLLHVLPSGFFKIRYYGLLASRNKKKNLILACKLLNTICKLSTIKKDTWQKLLLKITGFDVNKCLYCNKGQMKMLRLIRVRGHPF